MNNSLKRNTKEELYIFAPNLDFVLSHRRDLLNKLTNAYKITLFTDTSNFNNIVEANLSSLKIKNLKMRSHKRSLKILTSFTYMKSCLRNSRHQQKSYLYNSRNYFNIIFDFFPQSYIF